VKLGSCTQAGEYRVGRTRRPYNLLLKPQRERRQETGLLILQYFLYCNTIANTFFHVWLMSQSVAVDRCSLSPFVAVHVSKKKEILIVFLRKRCQQKYMSKSRTKTAS